MDELRVPRRDEADAIAAVLNEQSVELTGRPDVTPAEVAGWFDEPGLDPERDMRVVLDRRGTLAGYADLGGGEEGPLWIDLRLHPSAASAGSTLLGEMERCARERGAPPRALRIAIHADDDSTRQLLDGARYRFVRSGYRFEIDLTAEARAPAWPGGLSVRPFDPGQGTRVYEAYVAAFADSPDFHALPYEQWAFWLFEQGGDPAFGFVADDAGEIAGLSILRERRGGDAELGWIHVVGVRPAWRRRGLGRALLLHALDELCARGKARAGLGVDGANRNAIRLYETAGMRVVRRSDVYEKAS